MGTVLEAEACSIHQRAGRHLARPQPAHRVSSSGVPAGPARRIPGNEGEGNTHHNTRTEGSQIVSGLAVAPSDPVVIKKRYSAFYGTTLDGILTGLNPDGLILAGINTHACIRMAAIDAYQRDWEVILAADCVDSYDREHHDISLRYRNGKIASVMSNEEIRRMLA